MARIKAKYIVIQFFRVMKKFGLEGLEDVSSDSEESESGSDVSGVKEGAKVRFETREDASCIQWAYLFHDITPCMCYSANAGSSTKSSAKTTKADSR